jgi:hypothetical protein
MHFFAATSYICIPNENAFYYGTASTGKHQKALGFLLFLADCDQCNALSAFHKAFLLACAAVCGNGVCQGNGYNVI